MIATPALIGKAALEESADWDYTADMSQKITITDSASTRIKALTASKAGARLRLGVMGGGCSGFQYEIKVDSAVLADDISFSHAGAEVVVDAISLPYLDGCTLDYVETLASSGFEVKNPNAKSSCGCKSSFAI